MKRICLYPGSFDPMTSGHADVIARAARLFDEVVVAVMVNPRKSGAFTLDERKEMLEVCLAPLSNVRVIAHSGALLACAREVGACAVIRGLRCEEDFSYEYPWAVLNAQLAPDIESVFLMSAPEYAAVSSSKVKELAALGFDVSRYVPQAICKQVQDKLGGSL